MRYFAKKKNPDHLPKITLPITKMQSLKFSSDTRDEINKRD